MSEGTLTHKNLAAILGVSETTIKSYRRKFPGVLPVAGRGKPIRFKKEAADICLKIRDLFALGFSVGEIDERLFNDFAWRRPKTQSDENKKSPARAEQNFSDLSQSLASALGNMAKSIVALNETQTQVLSALKRLEDKLSGLERNLSVENAQGSSLPEDILDLPLLVRRPDGSYAAAGGEKHGPLSLRAVSAMLAGAPGVSGRYVLRHVRNNKGAWVVITGEDARSAGGVNELRFTFHEITSARGIKVLEIRNCLHNNVPRLGMGLAEFLGAAGAG
jgi:DNA-binding transcriptional MerR regulator